MCALGVKAFRPRGHPQPGSGFQPSQDMLLPDGLGGSWLRRPGCLEAVDRGSSACSFSRVKLSFSLAPSRGQRSIPAGGRVCPASLGREPWVCFWPCRCSARYHHVTEDLLPLEGLGAPDGHAHSSRAHRHRHHRRLHLHLQPVTWSGRREQRCGVLGQSGAWLHHPGEDHPHTQRDHATPSHPPGVNNESHHYPGTCHLPYP